MRERLERQLPERYAIERELGRGGMASVWLAQDRRDDRRVAIKVLDADLAGAIGAERFIREIRLTTRLQHPSIVPVLDSGVLPAGDDVALPWYAMPFIPGESLRARLQRDKQLPIDEAVRITRNLATALQFAHRQGIVHRDIKPDNVILSGDDVSIVDFGIAKALLDTGAERLTSTGLAVGTPMYMSPEQATAEPVDARTDQYSLAAVLYEMLTGDPPVTGSNTQAIIARRLAAPVQSIRTVRPTVSVALEAAVLRALERVPADRFPDVAAFSAALGGASVAGVAPATRRAHRSRLALAGLAIAAIAAGAGWVTMGRRAAPTTHVVDPEVEALYQRGMREYDRRTPASVREAVTSFNAALARDSSYSRAWVGLAKSYVRVYERRFDLPRVSRDSVLRLVVISADRALLADSNDAQTWVAQAVARRTIDPTDVAPAIRAARRAIALDSLDGPAWHFLAISLAESGDMRAALDAWHQCVRRAPTYTQGLTFLALGYYWRKQYDSAKVWADSAIAVDPSYMFSRTSLGEILSELGDQQHAIANFEAGRRLASDIEIPNQLAGRAIAEARAGRMVEARATLQEADSLTSLSTPTPLHNAIYLASAWAQMGDTERAMSWLARYAGHEDLHFQLHLRCDPPLAMLATDDRFRALLLPGTRVGNC